MNHLRIARERKKQLQLESQAQLERQGHVETQGQVKRHVLPGNSSFGGGPTCKTDDLDLSDELPLQSLKRT